MLQLNSLREALRCEHVEQRHWRLPEPGGLPVFEREDQTELARALDNAKGKCDFSDEPFEEADYIEAEGRWIEK